MVQPEVTPPPYCELQMRLMDRALYLEEVAFTEKYCALNGFNASFSSKGVSNANGMKSMEFCCCRNDALVLTL